jgi:hypothetical protein
MREEKTWKNERNKHSEIFLRCFCEGDIVVMVQSDCFRLDEYRFRLKLFERHLKNIEHVHLGFIPTQQYLHYVNALSFDPQRDGSVGLRLKQHIDKTKKIVVECYGGTQLVYDTEMEPTLLNIGDYSGMKNVGGTFPIGLCVCLFVCFFLFVSLSHARTLSLKDFFRLIRFVSDILRLFFDDMLFFSLKYGF